MSKPLKEFIELINYAFQEGNCQCVRCLSGEDHNNFGWPHNFEIDGATYHRQFARSGAEELLSRLSAVLSHHNKDTEYDFTKPIPESIFKSLLEPKEHALFLILGKANRLIESIEKGHIKFNLDYLRQ